MPIDGRTVKEVKVDFKMFEAVSGIYYLGGYVPVGGGYELAGITSGNVCGASSTFPFL